MAKAYANRVWMTTATAGTGTITLGSAKAGYLTFAEAGVADTNTVTYVLVDGDDFEIGTGTYTSSGTTMSRDTVTVSKISGTAGTTKLTLSGSAEVFLSNRAAETVFVDRSNAFTEAQQITIAASSDRYWATQTSVGTVYFGIDSGGAYVWSNTTSVPLRFLTEATERMRVASDGTVRLLSSDAGATAGPFLDLFRDSASPIASDIIGRVAFSGRDSAANAQDYAYIQGVITSPTSTTETGDLAFLTVNGGTLAEKFRIASHGGLGIGGATYGTAGDHLSSNGSAAPSWNPTPLRGHIWGLTMSNNGTDAANDIDVAAGAATDEGHAYVMVLAASITKRLDAAWAVGTNQGGLNTGAEANSTWYEVHLIRRPDTGVVDVMFTTTANRATLPANYTQQRRIGWIRNDSGGTILPFTQVDDHFTLTTQINDVAVTATATAAAVTLTVPPSCIARFRASITSTTNVNTTDTTVFSEIVEGNVTPSDTTGIASLGANDIAGSSAGHFELRVSSSSTIEHDSDGATYSFDISTFGWIDTRRRLSAT